jgi:hypothetical protein
MIEKIIDLIIQVLPIVKPSDLQKIKNKINDLEKENEEKRKRLIEAVASGDIDTINSILFG